MSPPPLIFFFNDTATTEIYTLSLHDALPISWMTAIATPTSRSSSSELARGSNPSAQAPSRSPNAASRRRRNDSRDRKSTRLNSSHGYISYAVFCLKKKKKEILLERYLCVSLR